MTERISDPEYWRGRFELAARYWVNLVRTKPALMDELERGEFGPAWQEFEKVSGVCSTLAARMKENRTERSEGGSDK